MNWKKICLEYVIKTLRIDSLVITLHRIDCTRNKRAKHEYMSFFIIHDPKQALLQRGG